MVDTTDETSTQKGISLARGPALILGVVLLAAGLYFIIRAHYFPRLAGFPNGHAPVDTKVLGIFGANGWTGMLTAIGGGLLLFGAAQHLLAKAMSLIVGVALAAAAIIALIHGNVLGLAAANGWTELGWGIAAAILLINTLAPRRRRTVAVAPDGVVERPRTAVGATARTDRMPQAEREVVPVRSSAPVQDEPTAVHDDQGERTAVLADDAHTTGSGVRETGTGAPGTAQTEVVDRDSSAATATEPDRAPVADGADTTVMPQPTRESDRPI
jgi:hypothetical protein